MINSYEKEKLSSLLKDFYVAIGMRISVFDDQFRLITEYPQHPPELCAMIRSTEKGFAACKKCDEEAFLRARKMHTAHSYVCHAGLTEAITPILLDREVMGYAIFAHLLPAENYREHVDEICKRCKDYCDSEEKIRSAVSKLKKYSGQKITSSMRILEAIASFLQISNVINWKMRISPLTSMILFLVTSHKNCPVTSFAIISLFPERGYIKYPKRPSEWGLHNM